MASDGNGGGPPRRDNLRNGGQRHVHQALQIVESFSSVANLQEDPTYQAENDNRNYRVNLVYFR